MSNPNAKGRPRLQSDKNAVRINFSLPARMARRLRGMNQPISEIVRDALAIYLRSKSDEKSNK